MELRHLRYFITVAELLNFTKSAAKLHVAQPALSRQIHDLEEELGVVLFERSSRYVRLTAAGKAFVTEARTVLQSAEVAAQTARAFATGERGELHIGYAPSLTVEVLPKALEAFEQRYPRVRVTLHDLSVLEMVQGLNGGAVDTALMAKPLTQQLRGLAFDELRTYPVRIAVRNNHPLARAKGVSLAQLAQEPLIVYSRAEYPDYHEWIRGVFEQARQVVPQNAEEHDSGTSIVAAVEAGRGLALVPSILSSVAGGRLTLLGIRPTLPPFVIGVAYRRDQQNPAARRFVDTVNDLKIKCWRPAAAAQTHHSDSKTPD